MEEGVAVLGTASFDAFLEDKPLALVEFYAPWCGHCKNLAPEYASAAQRLADRMPLAKVDATENRELGQRFGVTGYPTLKLFRYGRAYEYKGGRTADTIVTYLEKQLEPAVRRLASRDDLEAFKTVSSAVFVAFLGDAQDVRAFEGGAASLRDEADFGLVTDAAALGEAAGTIVAFQNFDDGRVDAPFDPAALADFVRTHNLPQFGHFDEDLRQKYTATKLPILVAFEDGASSTLRTALQPVVADFVGAVKFVWVNGRERKQDLLDLGGTGDTLPAIGLRAASGAHYALEGDGDGDDDALSGAEVAKWIRGVLNGRIKPSLRSQKPPAADPKSDVKVVVAKTFEKDILRSKEDVLLEIYAPYCGHCKKLEPTWEALATQLKGEVTVAKIDGTANDLVGPGGGIRGYPTIRFYPAKDKMSPVVFDGTDRSMEKLMDFVKEHASRPIGEGSSAAKGKKSGGRRRGRK